MAEEIRPSYYKSKGGDLFSFYEEGLLTEEETRGFYKGNVIKYLIRYQGKNGLQDLDKASTYLSQLSKFEVKLKKEKAFSDEWSKLCNFTEED